MATLPGWRDVSTPWPTDRHLVSAALRGDREAADELAARTYTAVFASLFRMCGDSDLAADLTQETYQRAWRALPTFNGRSLFSTWLYRIAYTTFLNYIRTPRRVVPTDDPDAFGLPDPDPPADETLSSREEAERMRKAVLGLPDELRFVVTAHFWGELEVKEIAQLEGMTGMGIRKRLKKAFAILGAELGEVKS